MDTSGNRQDIILKISEEEERIIQRKNKELAEKEKETGVRSNNESFRKREGELPTCTGTEHRISFS